MASARRTRVNIFRWRDRTMAKRALLWSRPERSSHRHWLTSFVINYPLAMLPGATRGNQDGNVCSQRSLAPNLVSGSGSAVPDPVVCTRAKSRRRQTQPAPRLDTEWIACAVFSGGAEGVVSQSRPRCDDRGRHRVGGHDPAGRSRAVRCRPREPLRARHCPRQGVARHLDCRLRSQE
jgi:hypothetical protein